MTFTVALIGNPNCGKTTMFNRLTGSSQRVGNWPGVTIDKKEGRIKGTDDGQLVDLPGIYSLSPYSPEEVISRDFIVEERPDAVLNIVDATNLERNLYLTMQVLDCNIPVVVALNMMDEVEKKGYKIDVEKLSKELKCPIIPVSALRGDGIDKMVSTLSEIAMSKKASEPSYLNDKIERFIADAEDAIRGKVPDESIRWYAIKLLEKDDVIQNKHIGVKDDMALLTERFEKEFDDDVDAVIADARYNLIENIVSKSVEKPEEEEITITEKVDNIITNKYLALPIFIAVIALIYYISVTTIGTWGTETLNGLFGDICESVRRWCIDNSVSPILTGLLCDGIIKGVGSILSFLPQMIVLFLLMCVLEDIGYMSRIAFMMDRVFRYFGLSGKSFIPVLVGTGCGVPGIMSTRTIESERDRRITAMTVTFMPCGAKLPLISMIAAILFGNSWLVGLFAYFLGILCVLVSGIILKKWRSLSGKEAPFIMELPPYHVPAWYSILKTTFDRSWAFVKRAGTIIMFACVFVWFLSSFDTSMHFIGEGAPKGSILQAIGQAICGIFAPLGWGSWELSVSCITGLIAKENIIGTIQILLGDAGIASVVTAAGGLSFMVFNLVCAPCAAAMGSMKRELGDWKSTLSAIAYQCLLAYGVSAIVYVIAATLLGESVGIASYIVAFVSVAILIFVLTSKDPFRQLEKEGVPS